jgi:hypothetical protein
MIAWIGCYLQQADKLSTSSRDQAGVLHFQQSASCDRCLFCLQYRPEDATVDYISCSSVKIIYIQSRHIHKEIECLSLNGRCSPV